MAEKILFGTYTKSASKGIYEATFDDATGTMGPVELVAEVGSPTYVALSKANKLYAVDRKNGEEGGIAMLDYANDQAEMVQEVVEPGASAAYVAVDEVRQFVYSANYHRGLVQVFKIEADGQLTETDRYQATGKGPRPEQASSHMHFFNVTPDGRLVAVDLGSDNVLTFDLSADGKLTLVNTYTTEPGYGPRHIRFSADGKHAYLLGELSSKLTVLSYNEDGSLTPLQVVSTIPADWTEHNGTAAIYLSNDNRFLYSTNRGHNSMAVFEIQEDGAHVELIQLISTEGDFPRDFALSPSNDYLIAANQNTDNVTIYSRDAQSGKLTLKEKDLFLPEGVCVKFI